MQYVIENFLIFSKTTGFIVTTSHPIWHHIIPCCIDVSSQKKWESLWNCAAEFGIFARALLANRVELMVKRCVGTSRSAKPGPRDVFRARVVGPMNRKKRDNNKLLVKLKGNPPAL